MTAHRRDRRPAPPRAQAVLPVFARTIESPSELAEGNIVSGDARRGRCTHCVRDPKYSLAIDS